MYVIYGVLLRSEQLLRERMRATGNGITSYNYIHENDSIVVHGSHCVAVDWQSVSNGLSQGMFMCGAEVEMSTYVCIAHSVGP